MRKTTSVIVGVASATAIGASWAAGLAPKHDAVGGVTLSAPPAPPASTSGSTSGASRGSGASHGSATSTHTKSASKSSNKSTSKPAALRPRTIDGGVANTQYGNVQVAITVTGSNITDVTALHLTDSSGHSARISAYAAPILRKEALSKQSAQIDMVSGATYTSEAYQQSLQSAIDAAHI
ncbi:FMN-binding protein [Intrasporangium sp. YIM S08009]|uniref:FMN-binding protein n=1 Tax=Intrasporangium zincisolvens TaxID=3080018 RepID=UPI002B0623AA|nr:FMN-binding protein [Intrasporangium sp. YIM S08009]